MGKEDVAFLTSQIMPGMTVVDVGANIGVYTLLFSRLVGEHGQVIAFEPDPILFAVLGENIALNNARNVTAHQIALGSEWFATGLRRGFLNWGDNRLQMQNTSNSTDIVSVQVAPLDQVIGNQPVDFIKIDVQGREMEVLRGMEAMLREGRPPRIYFEYWPEGLRRSGYDPLDVIRLLESHRYSVTQPDGVKELDYKELVEIINNTGGLRFVNLLATDRSVGHHWTATELPMR
jgi:FkbM family methyltransferase